MYKTVMKLAPVALLALVASSPAAAEQSVVLDESTLEKFAAAYEAVNEAREQHLERMEQASSREEARAAQIRADAALVAAAEENGLSPEAYNDIVRVLRGNEELQQQVAARVTN